MFTDVCVCFCFRVYMLNWQHCTTIWSLIFKQFADERATHLSFQQFSNTLA